MTIHWFNNRLHTLINYLVSMLVTELWSKTFSEVPMYSNNVSVVKIFKNSF